MLSHKEYLNLLQETVSNFHNEETLPSDIPEAQHESLLPTLRPYQVRAVKWMLARELYPEVLDQEHEVKLPSGGILADEMGLGKTVEVLACILANPRKLVVNKIKEESEMEISLDKNLKTLDVVEIAKEESGPVEEVKAEDERFDVVEIAKQESGPVEEVKAKHELKAKVSRKRVQFDEDCVVIPVKKFKLEDTVSETIEDVIKQHAVGKSSRPKRNNNQTGIRSVLQSWYSHQLLEMSPNHRKKKAASYYNDPVDVKCCCVNEVNDDDTVQCPLCKSQQHPSCVGYVASDNNDYFCFNCWKEQPPVKSSATVIISPQSICSQWNTEIEKHIKKDNIKVLVYNGVRVNGYIQPPNLAQYDLVITTYEVLRKEIHYADVPTEGRHLRNVKRYFSPTSPLTCVQWWRICLDEAQMVEGSTTNTAEMVKKFSSIHKWAVTGTPIQKSVHDLYGLFEFLEIIPYNNSSNWKELVSDTEKFLQFLPRVLWRTAKKDVMEELGVPEQKVVPHWLDFSPVETYFYKTQHTECSSLFLQKVSRFKDLSVALSRIDRRLANGLMLPLLRIRQACSHPQAVRGQFVSIKKTMTMEDLLVNMVDKAKLDCEEVLRQIVASLNGIAGLHIIQEDYLNAINAYRGVLQLVQEHKGKLKVDSLQKIHTMHNLAEVLEVHSHLVPPTLRDGQLRLDAAELEQKYLDKRETSITTIKKSVDKYAASIEKLCGNRTLGYSEWWLNVLESTDDHDELLDKLKTSLERTDILQQHQHNNLAKKLNSLPAVRIELAKWLAQTDSCRQEVLSLMKDLECTSREDLAAIALLCHLPPGSTTKKAASRCQLCICESTLKQYEALLFEERSKTKRKQTQRSKSQKQTEAFNTSQKNKGVADLVNVNLKTSEFSKKGGLKASQHERVLKDLKSFSRSKYMHTAIWQDAIKHLELLGLVKKEFLHLNSYWTQISEQVLARDELNMAKLRLRLPLPDEVDDDGMKKKSTKEEKRYIIQPFKVMEELYQLQSDKVQSEQKFRSKFGTLLYLQNLQREGDITTCPICRSNPGDKWSVLHCGHCICLDCLPMMLKQSRSSISCVQCRQQCAVKDISYVMNSTNEVNQLKGSYSTKVEAVMMEIMKLREADPHVKVLLFSSWDKVLDVIAEGFEMNEISFRKHSCAKAKTALNDFKTKDVTALLLSLNYGAKGLNLVEATHVFLVEPVLNPSDELQAIGRIHRIGQTRETFVHRFIVKNTIEERMLSAVEASGVEHWSKEEITLQQLHDLFTVDTDMLGSFANESEPTNMSNTSHAEEPSTSHEVEDLEGESGEEESNSEIDEPDSIEDSD